MSIGSFFKAIGHGIEKVFNNKVITSIAAAIPGPIGIILQAVINVEQLITGASQGTAKLAAATAITATMIPGANVSQLQGVINGLVAALNAAGVFHNSIPSTTVIAQPPVASPSQPTSTAAVVTGDTVGITPNPPTE